MSNPIDLKTVKIFEPLKRKPGLDFNKEQNFNSSDVYGVLQSKTNLTVKYWFKLQQAWCNNAYNTFKDYDTYLILI